MQIARLRKNETLSKEVEKKFFDLSHMPQLAFPQLPLQKQLATLETTRGVVDFSC
jgi:hypothetical protein